MPGGGKNTPDGTVLDDGAGVHHGDTLDDIGDQREVVRDPYHRHAEPFLQLADQLDNLCLDRHVQRRGRLVGYQQARLADDRHGDHDTLPLATGELMRVVGKSRCCVRDAHQFEGLDDTLSRRGATHPAVHTQRLGQLIADIQHRVQRRHRILENHGDVASPQAAQAGFRQLAEIDAVEQDPAARHLARRRNQAHQRQRADRFAATAFTDDGERLAGIQRVGKVGNGVHVSVHGVEDGTQVLHFE